MIDMSHAFDSIDAPNHSIQSVVQSIREHVEMAPNPVIRAGAIIDAMIGTTPAIDDARYGRVLAQRIAVLIVEHGFKIASVDELVKEADVYARKYITDPNKTWMWATADAEAAADAQPVVVDGVVTQPASGKIKKGGKQVLVLDLYKAHVLEAETPLSNQEFVQVVMKELQMSKAGATTYAWNAKKELGEPEGGIVKAKKGRKPKAV
jgi:hypothetical protein